VQSLLWLRSRRSASRGLPSARHCARQAVFCTPRD